MSWRMRRAVAAGRLLLALSLSGGPTMMSGPVRWVWVWVLAAGLGWCGVLLPV